MGWERGNMFGEKGRERREGDLLGNIDYACHVALHGSAREEKVNLIVRVAEAAEVLNATCHDLLVKET
jgi:hypothetical protein